MVPTDFTCTHKEWTDTLVDTILPISFLCAVSTMVPTDFTCTHKEWTDTSVDTTLPMGFLWAVSTMVPTGLESFPL